MDRFLLAEPDGECLVTYDRAREIGWKKADKRPSQCPPIYIATYGPQQHSTASRINAQDNPVLTRRLADRWTVSLRNDRRFRISFSGISLFPFRILLTHTAVMSVGGGGGGGSSF